MKLVPFSRPPAGTTGPAPGGHDRPGPRRARPARPLFLLLLLLAVSCASAATTIAESNIIGPTGLLARGTITIAPTVPFAEPTGQYVAIPVTIPVVNGHFSVTLEPNDVAIPANTQYIVTWRLDGQQPRTERWLVPTSLLTLRAKDVAITPLQPSVSIACSQIAGTCAWEPPLGNPAVDAYVLSSTIAGVRSWIAQSGGGGGGGVSSVFGRTGAVTAQNGDYTSSQVGLGSVTNDAQTKAAVVPNTAPSSGQVLFGNAGASAYAPQTVSGDCMAASTGAITCTKLNNVAVAIAATANTIAERNGSGELIAANTPATGKTAVDTDSTQTLTGKTLDGVTPTLMGYVDPSSSIQTQLNGKAASSAATTVNGQTCTLGSTCTVPLSAVNPQISTYQVVAGDFSGYKTITVASGTFTITLMASGSQPAAGQYIKLLNYGSGVVTVARSGQNINGGTASLTIPAASATVPAGAFVVSDGTNYFAHLTGSVVGPGSSTNAYVPQWSGTSGNALAAGLAVSTTTANNSIAQRDSSGNLTAGLFSTGGSTIGQYYVNFNYRIYGSIESVTCSSGAATLGTNYTIHRVNLNNQATCAITATTSATPGQMGLILLCNGSTTATTTINWTGLKGGMAAGGSTSQCAGQTIYYDTANDKWYATSSASTWN